jgi:hypothetical protein
MPSIRVALATTAILGTLTANMGSAAWAQNTEYQKTDLLDIILDAPASVGKKVEITGFVSLGFTRTYIHKTSRGGSAKLFLFTGELSRDDHKDLLLHCSDASCPAIIRGAIRNRDGDINAESVRVLSLSEAAKIMGTGLLR